ncbi:MAG TPA: hypothetical protein VJ441_01555 [Dehalococcoidia bacterium]|nr:hypothetical protein [Dehalococcoidia bacterium]
MEKVRESEFYGIVRQAIEDLFSIQRYSVDCEITGHPKGKQIPDRFLRSSVLLKHKRWLPTPDIMGLVQRKPRQSELVIVEFKLKPTFMDIFQAKGYGQLFDSDFTFLISQHPLYESSRKVLDFVKQSPELLSTGNGREVIIEFLHKTPEGKITLAQLGSDVGILPDAIL